MQMASEPQFADRAVQGLISGEAEASAEGMAMTGVGESARYSSGAAYEETGTGVESGTDAFGEDFVGYSESAEPEATPEPVSVAAESAPDKSGAEAKPE
jgi:hypothetical protein